ncbi:MAG TPA: alanine racemase [Chitinophagaceae bacterium]|nr:alanine racemase [Chitinophagaceae bacterium]
MAHIVLNKEKLQHNYTVLNNFFKERDIEWGVVAKLLCGNEIFLREVINLGIKQICDSRISNLSTIKKINPNVETVYIKPTPKRSIEELIEVADVSFNTELETIKKISEAAQKANKLHKIVIMLELGELREGVMREEFVEFYEEVFRLPNIEIAGIGTNLTCMYGVLPNNDKLIQLSLYTQIIEAKFNRKIPYISGGASVTIPLIKQGLLPQSINHFRVGETLFCGTDVYNNEVYPDMNNDVFTLYAEVLEINEKPMVPDGDLGLNLMGEQTEVDTSLIGKVTHRALVDIGLLDIESEHIWPKKKYMEIIGASSDMLVIDLKENDENIKVGDLIPFKMNYMGILRIMNSDYVDKKVI